jgi:butyryl-CoA dehydrogenase
MDFTLSKPQLLLQEMVRRFAQEECKAVAEEMDETETFNPGLLAALKKYGILSVAFSRDYGGAGLGYMGYAIAVEELSKIDASSGVTLSVHNLSGQTLIEFANSEQKERFARKVATAEAIGCFALTEPNAGTDASGLETKAVLEGDHYVVNGSKMFITNSHFADLCILMCVTDKSKGNKGLSALVVDMHSKGVTVGPNIRRMGIRGASNAEVSFENVVVPKSNLLGGEGQGFAIAMHGLDGGRVGIAAQAVGIAQGAIDETIAYTKVRKQFGKSIASFQNTKFQLADCQTMVDAARLLVYQAASAHDAGLPYGLIAAKAKLFASKIAVDVTRECVQLMGGYGYSREYPVERAYRDAKITEIYEGTSEAQRMVIAKAMNLK